MCHLVKDLNGKQRPQYMGRLCGTRPLAEAIGLGTIEALGIPAWSALASINARGLNILAPLR